MAPTRAPTPATCAECGQGAAAQLGRADVCAPAVERPVRRAARHGRRLLHGDLRPLHALRAACDTEEPTAAPTMAPTAAPTPACDGTAPTQCPHRHGACPRARSSSRAATARADQLRRLLRGDLRHLRACEKPCPAEREIPTAAPTRAPTAAPTSAPTAAPEEPCDTEVEPAPCSPRADQGADGAHPRADARDVRRVRTRSRRPAGPSRRVRASCPGQCAERARMADGYCMATCGFRTPCPVDTVHGDPMFKHNGEGFKFSIPAGP